MRILLALTVTLILAACGGGGSGGDPTPTSRNLVVQGPITGFGSVVINGIHYETSASTEVEIDDDSTGRSESDLQVGQIVTLRGRVDDDGTYFADSVSYDAEIKGPISSIDPVAGTFVALGQTVIVTDATVYSGTAGFETLAVNDVVEVSGSRDAGDNLVASFIELEDGPGEAEVHGTISALDTTAQTFLIGDLSVDYGDAVLMPSSLVVANDLFVEVEGTLVGGVLVAAKLKQDDDFDDEDEGHDAEVEGLVQSLLPDGFVVGTTAVRVSGSTDYEGGSLASIQPGVKVEVEGVVAADGVLDADKVEIETAGTGGSIAGAITAIDAGNQTITVLGITLRLAPSTLVRDDRDDAEDFAFADLVVGDFIDAGFIETATGLQLTRLEREDGDDESEIRGALDSADAPGDVLVVAGVTVSVASAQFRDHETSISREAFFAAATTGRQIKAQGSYSAGVLTATEVELDDHNGDDLDDDEGSDDD